MPKDSLGDTISPKTHFVDMFNNFFEKGVMAGTQKAIFLRALTDIGKYERDDLIGKQWIQHEGDKIRLDLNFIASRFAKYYWDEEITFGMRHTPRRMADQNRPDADIRIVKFVREESQKMAKEKLIASIKNAPPDLIENEAKVRRMIEGTKRLNPPTLVYLASPKMKEFRNKVIKQAMNEVLEHLPTDMPDLYTWNKERKQILLDPSIIEFMKKFAPIIKKALNYVLAIHLEKNNPEARHIATKIDEETELEKRIDIIANLQVQVEGKRVQIIPATEQDAEMRAMESERNA